MVPIRIRAVGTLKAAPDLEQRLEAALKRLEALEVSFKQMQERMAQLVQDVRFQEALARLPDKSDMSSSNSDSHDEKSEIEEVPSVTGRVTVCMGKDCQKQGSQEMLKRVGSVLALHSEMENIKVKTCKCLDECGKGPVISTKFGKAKGHKHKKVKGKTLEALLVKEMRKAQ